MCVVHFCGSKTIIPHNATLNRELFEDGIKVTEDKITTLDLKKVIFQRTNIPVDHLKIFSKDMELLEDSDDLRAAKELYFSIITCKNPQHCPMQLRISTLFGQIRAPFTENTTVGQLKHYIAAHLRVEKSQLKLQFNHLTLKEDEETLVSLGIRDCSEIKLTPKTR